MVQQVEITPSTVHLHPVSGARRTCPCFLVVAVANAPLWREHVCLLVAEVDLAVNLFVRCILRLRYLVMIFSFSEQRAPKYTCAFWLHFFPYLEVFFARWFPLWLGPSIDCVERGVFRRSAQEKGVVVFFITIGVSLEVEFLRSCLLGLLADLGQPFDFE